MINFHDWMLEAVCRKVKNDFWYPPLEEKNPEQYYAVGRELCRRCPVWKDCLKTGIEERWGMWGGLTPLERTPLTPAGANKTAHKPHGSWIRYRQGCKCSACVEAHNKPVSKLNTSVLPSWDKPIDDVEILHFKLLSQDS
jgi:hypothetical protein